MLNSEDKKWLAGMMDQKIDHLENRMDQKLESLENRMDQKMDAMRDDLIERMDQKDARLRADVNDVITRRDEEMLDLMGKRIDRKMDEISRRYDVIYENRILPMIKEHISVLPDAGHSYTLLEKRVRVLEDQYAVLRLGLKAHLEVQSP